MTRVNGQMLNAVISMEARLRNLFLLERFLLILHRNDSYEFTLHWYFYKVIR